MNSRYSLGYILLGIAALALFAIPLWYGYRDNLGAFRAYVPGAEMQRLADIFQRDGAQAAAAAVEAYLPSLPRDEVIVLADPDKRRLAGNLPAWPAEVPDMPGTYGLVIGLGAEQSMRVVVSHQALPGGYRLLMGRESVRFQSLVERFWYGIAAAVAVVLGLGALFAWLLRRSLLLQIGQISRNAAAIVEGDLSRRLPASGGSPELDTLAQTMNRMLEQLHRALQRQTKYLDELFDLAPDAIVLTEVNPSRIVRVNREFMRMFGYTAEEAVGRSLRELIAPGEMEAEYAANAAAVAAGQRVDAELVRQRKDGTRLHVHFSSAAVKTDDGKSAAYLVYRDITERKRAEEALRESEKRYALAMRASGEGHWDWKIASDEFYASPRYLEIGGFPPDIKFSRRADIVDRIPFHPDDRAKYEAAVAAHFAGETPRVDIVIRIVPHGEIRWLHVIGMCSRDADGKPVRWAGSVNDITERKLAADALRASEARFRGLTELSSDWYWEQDENLRFTYLSNQAAALTGYAGESSLGKTRWEIVNMTPLSCSWTEHRAVLAARQPFRDLECRRIGPDGTVRYLSMSGAPIFDEQGRFKGYRGIGRNITERKRIEEALRLSEERYALAMEASEEGHFDWNVKTDEIFASARLMKVLDLPADAEYRTRGDMVAHMAFYPGDRERVGEMTREVLAGAALNHEFEYRLLRGQAREPRWIRARWMIFRDTDGAAQRVIGVLSDITERKLAADELRESEARFRSLTALSSDWFWRQDENLRFTYSTAAIHPPKGYPGGSSIGLTRWELPGIVPLSSSWAEHKALLAARKPFRDFEYSRPAADGTIRYISISAAPIFDEQGRFKGYQGIGRNITDRKRIEEELRSRQEMLDLAQKSAQVVAFEWRIGADGRDRNSWSPEIAAMYGVAPEVYDGSFEQWKKLVHPDDWPTVKEALRHAQRTGEVAAEYRVVHPDGSVHWLQAKGRMFFDAEGKPARMVGFMHDVTQRRQAEEELRKMERQLRQAQRLEAVGTLAGGIAHDFNNILGAILGYGEMALRDAPKGSRLARDLDSIVVAGERGRALVDRLLAFSRSAVGERVPVHVEKVVREALDLISAKLPPNVTLHAKLHSGRAALLGDATQVHQVLMNLATNAIQAMPAGGTLRVSLSAARLEAPRTPTLGIMRAGDYLILEVADSGTGIAPEILDRIFDPFFTTKDVGTGTGLGLSLVHGIVSDLGGAIDVASTPGAGSTFTVFLPRSGVALESSQKEEPELPRGDGQRVLVVDDEEPLVRLATRTLQELGYEPTGFTSSTAALAAFRADPQRFDALITDERMPGMSGSSLIREVRGIRDGIPIVLMSGYIGGAVSVRARAAGAEEVLQKPMSARDLAASLARVLRQ